MFRVEKIDEDHIMSTTCVDDGQLDIKESTLFLSSGCENIKIGTMSYRIEDEERSRSELIDMFSCDIEALEAAENSLVDVFCPGDIYLQSIEIEPQFRGKGYGTMMLRWLETQTDGFSVFLTASYHDDSLIEFYENVFAEYELIGVVGRTMTFGR